MTVDLRAALTEALDLYGELFANFNTLRDRARQPLLPGHPRIVALRDMLRSLPVSSPDVAAQEAAIEAVRADVAVLRDQLAEATNLDTRDAEVMEATRARRQAEAEVARLREVIDRVTVLRDAWARSTNRSLRFVVSDIDTALKEGT